MKKIIFLILFLTATLLFCPPSTQAAGGSVEEKINIDPCAWWLPPAYHYLLDTIGCPCWGFDPMVWSPGNKYCYNKALNLDVRECTEGGHEHWNWSGGWYAPAAPCPADDPNHPNCECPKHPSVSNYHGEFCEDLRCNTCQNEPDDPECDALGLSIYPPGSFTSKCLKGEYVGDKSKQCYWCVRYAGSGAADTKKITVVYVQGECEADASREKVTNMLINTEPFKYLNYKKKLTIQFIDGYRQSGLSSDQEHGAHPLVKPFQYYYDNSTPPKPEYFTEETDDNIKSYVNKVCGNTDYVLVIDCDWKFIGTMGYVPRLDDGTMDNITFVSGKWRTLWDIVHELGHSIGQLGDEYYYEGNDYADAVNLDTDATGSEYFGICSKFDGYGVPRQNCFRLTTPITPDNKIRKSTSASVMNARVKGGGYNVIGCAAMLSQLGGASFTQGLAYCRNTPTPEGYKIYEGIGQQSCIDEEMNKEVACLHDQDCCNGICGVSGVCAWAGN